MVCIYNPSTELLNTLDRYSRILGSEEAAYYVLSLNNGFPLDKTPNGEDSDLYTELLNHYGNEEEAIRAKTMLYTQRFFDANGDWTVGTMNDPSMYDAKGEPKPSFVLNQLTDDMESLMNHLFLLDSVHPTIEETDLSRVSPTDSLSDYAVELLIRTSYDLYVKDHRDKYKKDNPTATDTELAEQEVIASRLWYSRKVQSIMTELVKSLAAAFGLVYVLHPNGTVELQTKGRTNTGVKELRLKFLNNIINDRFEDEYRTQIEGQSVLSKEFTLKVPGAKDYLNEAVLMRRKNDKLIAANTLINVSLTGGTSTTVNKALAYHYVTMFIDAPLIRAGLEAVRDNDRRGDLYLVNKLVDIITTPAITGVEQSSYIGRVFENGVTYDTFKNFWEEFDDLIDQVINKGVKSEEAKKKILSVVAAAFITNDQYNVWNKTFPYVSTAPIDYYAQWYSTKYKPWGLLNELLMSEVEAFFELLDTYYKNKIKRLERDVNISAEQITRTSLSLLFLRQSDKIDPTSQEEVIQNTLELAYQEIGDATLAILNLHQISGINSRFSRLGSMYSDTISFWNYILNELLKPFFENGTPLFPNLSIFYNMVKSMLSSLDGVYRTRLYDLACEFVDQYIDRHLDINQVTDEMVRNAKENAHLELRNAAIYGDLKNYELWITMNSLSKSQIVRMTADSLKRLNVNRDQDTLKVALQLLKALIAAKKSLLKGGLSWAGYKFLPRNFQLLFMERYNDGTPSGMFTRRRHYGNFFKKRAELVADLVKEIETDIQNKTGNIYFKMELDDFKNPIFPEGPEWDLYWRDYEHAVNKFECENGHKRFLLEYYDIRIDTLSRDAIALEDDIQNQIDIIESSVTEDGIYRPDKLSRDERMLLRDLYKRLENLASEYSILGEPKTGEDLTIAQEISNFREKIKDRILYETDWLKYEDAKSKVDPSELAAFEKASTYRDVNPKFWEIYKVLKKEYRDQFPSYLDPNFEEIDNLGKERQDIVNTVKKEKGFVTPTLRDLSDSAWARLKEIDHLMSSAYEPIIDYIKSLPKGALSPSAFRLICDLIPTMDTVDTSVTAFDAFMDEARNLDMVESAALGVTIHTHELEADNKYRQIDGKPLSVFSTMKPSVFPDSIKQRFGIDDSFLYVLYLPDRKYNKTVDPSSGRYTKPSLVDPMFDPKEDSYVQPTELNPIYELLEKEAPKEVFDLYKLCMQVKENADANIPISSKLKYFLPQMRASDVAIISRIISRGFLGTIQEVVSNKFIANETDEDIIDDFTTLPDGTRVNSVPLKFITKLDPTILTSDIVGALITYQHMSSNYFYKLRAELIFLALLQQLGLDSDIVTETGTRHKVLGKTSNQYAKEKNVIDNLLYDLKQLWGERGSQRLTGRARSFFKTLKTFAKLGTLMALSRNTLSLTAGFIDATGKLHSFAFAGDAFNVKNLTRAIGIFDKYLTAGRLFLSTGEIMPDNMIAAIMHKNGLSSSVEHKYLGGYKSKIRRFIGLERAGMGGFRVSDYAINAVTALSIYDNYRLLGDEFLPERSFRGKLRKLGLSEKDINAEYEKALPLLDAYNYKNSVFNTKQPEFELKDLYKKLLGDSKIKRLEQDIAIAIQTWTPKFNGAVSDADKAVIQLNILAGFTVALRSYLINELQTRFVNGADFQDPNVSKRKLEILEARRKSLAKAYKKIDSDSKTESLLKKLYQQRSDIELQLLNLRSSGDIKTFNWDNIKDAVSLGAMEAGLGYVIGSVFGPVGAYTGAAVGVVQGIANFYTNRRQSTGGKVGIFISKVRKLEDKLNNINQQIRVYDSRESRDLILMEIRQINEEIVRIKHKINENQGFYDYSRNLYTNGSNRLAGRLLMNVARRAQYYINTMFPDRFKSLSPTYKPKITENQIKGLKRIIFDLIRLSELYLISTFCLSWYRYDDGRAFLGGTFNDQTTAIMHKGDDIMRSIITPVMKSDMWADFWGAVHESSTTGVLSNIPFVGEVAENKSDAMLGYTKKVSRKTKEVSRKEIDAIQKQIDFNKAFIATQALKGFTEGIAPYDYQTINDLTNAVSATINVMTKSVESSQQMLSDAQQGKLYDPLQGGPYMAYFDRKEYGLAHSPLFRPFGYPAAFEQSTEIGLVNRMNYLSNTGLNKFLIPKKESVQKEKSKPKKKKKRGGRKNR